MFILFRIINFRLYVYYQVQQEDLLPKTLCHNCYELLNKFYYFKQKCIKSEERLHEYIEYIESHQIEPNEDVKPQFLSEYVSQKAMKQEILPELFESPSKSTRNTYLSAANTEVFHGTFYLLLHVFNFEIWTSLAYNYCLFVGSVSIIDGAASQALHTDENSEGNGEERGCTPIQESTGKSFLKVSKIKLWVATTLRLMLYYNEIRFLHSVDRVFLGTVVWYFYNKPILIWFRKKKKKQKHREIRGLQLKRRNKILKDRKNFNLDYHCLQCNKKFAYPERLEAHKLTHNGVEVRY